MDAIAFAAGELADKFLLVGTGEIELRNVCPRIHLAFAERHKIEAVGDLVKHGFVAIEAVA